MTNINNTINTPGQKEAKDQTNDDSLNNVDEAEERGKRPSMIGYMAGL